MLLLSYENKNESKLMLNTCTFTFMHLCIAFIVAYLISGDMFIGGAIAIVEPLCNAVGYFFHEKLWAKRKARAYAKALNEAETWLEDNQITINGLPRG